VCLAKRPRFKVNKSIAPSIQAQTKQSKIKRGTSTFLYRLVGLRVASLLSSLRACQQGSTRQRLALRPRVDSMFVVRRGSSLYRSLARSYANAKETKCRIMAARRAKNGPSRTAKELSTRAITIWWQRSQICIVAALSLRSLLRSSRSTVRRVTSTLQFRRARLH
jgi:hypothetical protein